MEIYNISNKDGILQYLREQLKPKLKEKRLYGEVFTPIELVEEMLDTLPLDVWGNKELRWLEPASGLGQFTICVFYRLMDGLKDVISDTIERQKHIIEKMLYMAELNKTNVDICRSIFGTKCNLYEGDFLELNTEKEWAINEFDIIVGNPPYNKGGIFSYTGKQLGEKNETIWPKFIEKSLQILIKNGYLAFINPLSWLRKSHSLHNTLLEKNIIWLQLWDGVQSKQMIKAGIPISLYLLENRLNTDKKKTEIKSIIRKSKLIANSNKYLDKDYSTPLAYHNIFDKLIKFIENNNCKLEYYTKTVKSTGTKTKIQLNYKLEDMLAIDTFTIKEGIMIKKANILHQDANKRKIIIANKTGFTGAFIDDGRLSLTGNHKFYILGNNLELILKILKFKISNIVTTYTTYEQSFLNSDSFKYLPDIRKLEIKDITENEFYKLIGFTEQEIIEIEKH